MTISEMGVKAKRAASELSTINKERKNIALNNLKKKLAIISSDLIEINKKDIENAHSLKLSSAMIDRLTLTNNRISSMIESLDTIIKLDDPVGIILSEWKRPNGLLIKKISTPIGVIGIIFDHKVK